MKVLFVLEHYHPYIGGVERLFKLLCEEVALINQVTVITTQHKKKLPQTEIINGVRVVRLPLKNRYMFTFFGWFWILKEARKANFIHTTSYNAGFPAFIAGLLSGKKVIITFHEVWGKLWFKVPFLSFYERFGFYFYEWILLKLPFFKIVAVSKFTMQKLLQSKVKGRKLELIYNGLPLKNWPSHNYSGRFNYTFFARLGVSKGIDIMIEGASIFNKIMPNAQFNFVLPKYPKPMRKKVLKLLKTYQVSNVNLLHELNYNQLQQLLQNSSCAVIPSMSEGFGFSAYECCLMQIPVVSSEKGALKEVTFGKVIEIKPYSAKGLADALNLANQNQWKEKPYKGFDIDDTVKSYMKLYQTL